MSKLSAQMAAAVDHLAEAVSRYADNIEARTEALKFNFVEGYIVDVLNKEYLRIFRALSDSLKEGKDTEIAHLVSCKKEIITLASCFDVKIDEIDTLEKLAIENKEGWR